MHTLSIAHNGSQGRAQAMRKACCCGCFKSDTQQRCRQVDATTCRACCLKHEWAVCDKPRNDLYCMCSGKDDSFVDSFSGFRGRCSLCSCWGDGSSDWSRGYFGSRRWHRKVPKKNEAADTVMRKYSSTKTRASLQPRRSDQRGNARTLQGHAGFCCGDRDGSA